MGAGNSAVVVDLPRWGPMLSPRVPNLLPIPGPGWSAKPLASAHDRIMGTHRSQVGARNPWSAPTTELWAPTRVDGYEVAGNGGLGAQELGPGQARALRSGVDAVLFEDSPHSGGPNAVTEADELAGDAAVAPRGVAGSHLDDETTQLHRGEGPGRAPGRVGSSGGRFCVGANAAAFLV